MAKSLVSAVRLHDFSRIVSSANANAQTHKPNQTRPRLPNRVTMKTETSEGEHQCRMPLSLVVADCAKRWFHDTLKEAKAGDTAMQLLLAQMYYSGYGVPSDPQKGHAWISKASRNRKSVLKASDKQIGYRTSDSDSCEMENKAEFFP